MPNLYVTPSEIKAAMPQAIRTTTIDYDSLLVRLADRISRAIDNHCERVFFPKSATRYYDGPGKSELRVKDLLEITTISYSEDDGETYTDLTSNDYYGTVEGSYNGAQSYTVMRININSDTLSTWPSGQRSVKIAGIWGYADDRAAAWEDSLDTVEDAPLSSSATTVTINDADGVDQWGATPRFQAGQLIKVGSEYIEVTAVDATDNTLTVVRGRNGTTAAEHAQNAAISIWRPPEPVKQAAIIQAARLMERGLQGYGDSRANAEVGQMFFLKKIDPEVQMYLQDYVW